MPLATAGLCSLRQTTLPTRPFVPARAPWHTQLRSGIRRQLPGTSPGRLQWGHGQRARFGTILGSIDVFSSFILGSCGVVAFPHTQTMRAVLILVVMAIAQLHAQNLGADEDGNLIASVEGRSVATITPEAAGRSQFCHFPYYDAATRNWCRE